MCNNTQYNYSQADGYIIPKMDRFKKSEDSDFDYRKYTRTFSGKMTKKRYKMLDRYCRLHSRSPRYRCGHDYDCCGCLCGQYMTFTYRYNAVTIHLQHTYNY